MTLSRRLAAELLGTALLVATVVGSGIMAQRLTGDGALALLANTVPTGAILVVLITILGPVSGAHLNPAVTLVFRLRGAIGTREALAYGVAQMAGGLLGTLVAHIMFAMPLVSGFEAARSGGPQWFSEAVATFGLVAVILAGLRARAEAVAWLVGLYITAAYWFTASTSFANPAVTLARGLTGSFAGIRLLDVPAFILAQTAGALLGLALMSWLLAPAEKDKR